MNGTVEHWCRLWTLEPVGATRRTTAAVLQQVRSEDGLALLKCLGPVSDEHRGASVMRWFDGQGHVRLLREGESAQLIEWIDGPPLSALVRDGRNLESADILADVVRKLHASRSTSPPPLLPLSERFSPLIAKRTAGTPLHVAAAGLARSLLADSERSVVLHGDIHHDNIMLDSRRGWLAIDPKGLVGDPHYDIANALCNPLQYPEIPRNPDRLMRQARRLSHLLSFDLDRVLSFAFCHACLAEIWSEEDGDDPDHWAHMSRVIAHVRTGG